jgi:prepilin peptidase CpaA
MMFLTWVVLVACAVAAATDIRTRRIPNRLTAALAAVVFFMRATQGIQSFALAVSVCAGVLVLGTVAFSFGWLGGGDVKLTAAVAASFSFPDALAFLIYASIAGGVFAALYATAIGRLGTVIRTIGIVLRPLAYEGTVCVLPPTRIAFPYATAIAAGALLVSLSHTLMPFLRLQL